MQNNYDNATNTKQHTTTTKNKRKATRASDPRRYSHHARLTPAGHTFLGHARPRPNNTPQPDPGLIERSARRTKPMPPGVMGHLPGNSYTLRTRPVSRPSYLLQQGRRLRSPTRRAPLSR